MKLNKVIQPQLRVKSKLSRDINKTERKPSKGTTYRYREEKMFLFPRKEKLKEIHILFILFS